MAILITFPIFDHVAVPRLVKVLFCLCLSYVFFPFVESQVLSDIYFVGVKLFGGPNTKSNHGELLRTIGFSSAPGLIRIFGITPDLMTVTFIGSAFWMLACMVVAVKSALDYDSLLKSFGVVVVAWLFQAFFLFLVLILFKGI